MNKQNYNKKRREILLAGLGVMGCLGSFGAHAGGYDKLPPGFRPNTCKDKKFKGLSQIIH